MGKVLYEAMLAGHSANIIRDWKMQETALVVDGMIDDSATGDDADYASSVIEGSVGQLPGPFPGTVCFEVTDADNVTNAESGTALASANSRSYIMWIRPDILDAFYGLFGSSTGAADRWTFLSYPGGEIEFAHAVSGAKSVVTDAEHLAVNTWSFVVATASASNALILYHNAVAVAQTGGTEDRAVLTAGVVIGDTGGTNDMNGRLAYCAIMDKILAPAEILALYTVAQQNEGMRNRYMPGLRRRIQAFTR